jgi:hypothetical protein
MSRSGYASGLPDGRYVGRTPADETIGRAELVLGEPVEGLDDAGFDAGGATGESDPVSPCTTLLSPSGGTHPALHSPYRNGVTTSASNADALEQRFGLQVQRAE